MSIPLIRRTASTQHAAASPSIAVMAAAVMAVLAFVMAAERCRSCTVSLPVLTT